MKLTKNRKLILRLLGEQIDDCGHLPPYSATSLHWAIHNLDYDDWYAKQDGTPKPKTKPNIQQIHRTLNDLLAAGLVVFESRVKERDIDSEANKATWKRMYKELVIICRWMLCSLISFCIYNNLLPARVKFWQLADEVDRNNLLREIKAVCNTAGKAHGTLFFGGMVDKPFTKAQKDAVILNIKALTQRTHPVQHNAMVKSLNVLVLRWRLFAVSLSICSHPSLCRGGSMDRPLSVGYVSVQHPPRNPNANGNATRQSWR